MAKTIEDKFAESGVRKMSEREFDRCATCGAELTSVYLSGTVAKRRKSYDEDGNETTITRRETRYYCSESCLLRQNAVQDAESFSIPDDADLEYDPSQWDDSF